MGLRIVLVGLVAALGLTVPTRERVGHWTETARAWVDVRLAERDARDLADETAFVVVPEPTPAVDKVTSNPLPTATTPVAPSEPVASRVEPATGLDTPSRPAVVEEFDAVPADAPSPTTLSADLVFDAAQDEVIAGFIADRPETLTAAAPAAFEPLDVLDDLGADVAYALNRAAEGLDAEAPRAEPLEVGDDLYEGVAYALNRAAEGLEPAPARVGSEPPVADVGRLTTAVRLTREAVYAWANLLHGPAVVTIGH